MSIEEKKISDAMRIFEALSGVDEELLARSEENRSTGMSSMKEKIVGWRFGKTRLYGSLVAAVCVAVVGLGIWTINGPMFVSKDAAGGYNGAQNEKAVEMKDEASMQEAAAMPEAAPEEETDIPAGMAAPEAEENLVASGEAAPEAAEPIGDAGSVEGADPECAVKESVTQETATQESAIEECGAPLDESIIITEAEASQIPIFGEYIPSNIPSGYGWEEGRVSKDAESGEYNSLHLTWTKGMDSISIIISVEPDLAKVANVEETESYDVRLYDIPYVETVPEEYREVFYAPVFLREDLCLEIIEARMKSVEDAGDTDTPRGNFSVLFDNGVLVRFNGRGTAEEIWQMFQSIK